MRVTQAFAVVIFSLPATVSAIAQELPDGVHLSPPELCEEARRNGIESVLEQGNLMLTRRGLEGYEYNCEFIDVRKAERSAGWLVTALCEEPGHAFPDVIAIMPAGEGEIQLTSIVPAGEDGFGGGNSGLYARCEGVSPP